MAAGWVAVPQSWSDQQAACPRVHVGLRIASRSCGTVVTVLCRSDRCVTCPLGGEIVVNPALSVHKSRPSSQIADTKSPVTASRLLRPLWVAVSRVLDEIAARRAWRRVLVAGPSDQQQRSCHGCSKTWNLSPAAQSIARNTSKGEIPQQYSRTSFFLRSVS